MPNKKTVWFMVILSFLGFLDATYLTVKHYAGTALVCNIFSGCDVVTTSKYSEILGQPIALLGAIYYLSMFFFLLYYLDTQKTRVLSLAAYVTVTGFIASMTLMYIQFFVLKALCEYCVFSALTSTTLFLCGATILWKSKRLRDD